jgi:hypothetical protein
VSRAHPRSEHRDSATLSRDAVGVAKQSRRPRTTPREAATAKAAHSPAMQLAERSQRREPCLMHPRTGIARQLSTRRRRSLGGEAKQAPRAVPREHRASATLTSDAVGAAKRSPAPRAHPRRVGWAAPALHSSRCNWRSKAGAASCATRSTHPRVRRQTYRRCSPRNEVQQAPRAVPHVPQQGRRVTASTQWRCSLRSAEAPRARATRSTAPALYLPSDAAGVAKRSDAASRPARSTHPRDSARCTGDAAGIAKRSPAPRAVLREAPRQAQPSPSDAACVAKRSRRREPTQEGRLKPTGPIRRSTRPRIPVSHRTQRRSPPS